MKKQNLVFAFLAALGTLASASASAGTLAAAAQRLASEIGKQSAITATTTCNLDKMTGNDGGNLGTVNQMLCIAKTMSLTGSTGASGLTTTVSIKSGSTTQTMYAHVVVTTPGPTINGTAYGTEVKVWTCATGCTVTTGFLPAMYMAYNADSAGTINNGILINHFGASSGTIVGSAFIKWDTGSATATKAFTLAMVDCSSSPTTAISAYYTRTGDVATMNDIVSQSSGLVTRTALAFDWGKNTGNWY